MTVINAQKYKIDKRRIEMLLKKPNVLKKIEDGTYDSCVTSVTDYHDKIIVKLNILLDDNKIFPITEFIEVNWLEKSTFSKFLESCKFFLEVGDEIDTTDLEGKQCIVEIENVNKNDKKYVNVVSFQPSDIDENDYETDDEGCEIDDDDYETDDEDCEIDDDDYETDDEDCEIDEDEEIEEEETVNVKNSISPREKMRRRR